MNNNTTQLQIVAFLLLAISIKLYVDHRRAEYNGPHKEDGSYDTLTPLKHDMMKQFSMDMFAFLVYGLSSGEKFFDGQNFLGSKLGNMMVSVAGYFVYYEIIEPYIAASVPKF
jgi:hypothetical protein